MKNKILIPFLSLTLIIAGIFAFYKLSTPKKPYTTDSLCMLLPNIEWTMERSVERSDLIAIVEVKERLPKSAVIGVVKQDMMGKALEQEPYILIPDSVPIEIGKSYLMLLSEVNSFGFPKNSYMTEGIDSVYSIDEKGRIEGFSQVADKRITKEINTLEKLQKYLDNHPKKALLENKDTVPDSFDNFEDLYNYSDCVLLVNIKDVFSDIDAAVIVEFDIKDTLKGETLSKGQGQFLPKNAVLTVGKDCYIFYKQAKTGEFFPSARNGAVIGRDDSLWNAAEEFLNNKKSAE